MEKNKIKLLLPSLRERKRYLAFEIISKSIIKDFNAFSRELIYNMSRFIGERGLSYAGIRILPDKFKNNKGIISMNHKHLDYVRAGLTFITKIEQQEVLIRSLGASGTLKKATSYLRS